MGRQRKGVKTHESCKRGKNHKIKLDEETLETHQKDMNTRNVRENDNKAKNIDQELDR